jgi:Rhodopirellula transposase DDE domain
VYSDGVSTDVEIKQKFERLAPMLDERTLRLFAAAEAGAIGYGGVSRLCRITGLARSTIVRGQHEMSLPAELSRGRVRRPGAGRKRTCDSDTTLVSDLESLVEPLSRGDPMSPLRWTCKSIRTLATALKRMGHVASHRLVWATLRELNYSLQGNRKMEEGDQHPDRNAQFEHINTLVSREMRLGNPVISVDTKKKELIGNYKNDGRKWHRKGEAPRVQGHDFPHPEVPRAYPYGIYDLAHNLGHVVVGTDHDTGQFAVASIRGWWRSEGRRHYSHVKRLLITADGGGSNGYRLRLWKHQLQRLADEIQLPISVCHFPPGTSKWNKVEHRLFSFISTNWRGEPLTNYETIVRLIATTTTVAGLQVTCTLDRRKYAIGKKVSDAEMKTIQIVKDKFHGEWNYTIRPKP